MLEITNKRLVTTRKPHECFGCMKQIKKGTQVISAIGKQDGKHTRLYLHVECNIKVSKSLADAIYHGCLNELIIPDWLVE